MSSSSKSGGSEETAARAEDRSREAEAKVEKESTAPMRGDRKVDEHRRLSALRVYAIVQKEGEEELSRPTLSLWWSGIAAGIGISLSVLAEGILRAELKGMPNLAVIESLGYTVGFIFVILSRLQLFTENTITAVLPVLTRPSVRVVGNAARLWGVVFVANLVGTALVAWLTLYIGTASVEHTEGMLEVSRDFNKLDAWEAGTRAIPAGFLIAAIVWMLPSAKGFEIFVIGLFTYLIAVGEFTHVIAGSAEVFLLMLEGEVDLLDGFGRLILPTFLGNVVGGTGLFALLAYGQVHDEF